MLLPVPKWIAEYDAERKRITHTVFLLRLAALYASPQGSLPELSRLIGRNPNYLTALCRPRHLPHPGCVSHLDAIAIETLVGRSVIEREMLRPDIFRIKDDLTTVFS